MESSLASRIVWAAIAGLAAYATIIFSVDAGYSVPVRWGLVAVVVIAVAALRGLVTTFMERDED